MAAGVTAATARVEEAALATVAGVTALTPQMADTDMASTLVTEATAAMAPAVTPTVVDMDTGSVLAAAATGVTPTVVAMDTAVAAITDVVTMDTEAITAVRTGAVRYLDLDSGTSVRHRPATTLMGIQCPVTCRPTVPMLTLSIEQGC
jgi:hypothetical protein